MGRFTEIPHLVIPACRKNTDLAGPSAGPLTLTPFMSFWGRGYVPLVVTLLRFQRRGILHHHLALNNCARVQVYAAFGVTSVHPPLGGAAATGHARIANP